MGVLDGGNSVQSEHQKVDENIDWMVRYGIFWLQQGKKI